MYWRKSRVEQFQYGASNTLFWVVHTDFLEVKNKATNQIVRELGKVTGHVLKKTQFDWQLGLQNHYAGTDGK